MEMQKTTRGMASGFMRRLVTDKSGNTMLMMAAALVPLAGMVGGGLDLGRGYLTKSRLQQACDAGVLAGRKAMSGNTLTNANKEEAYRFFFFNFPNQAMGTDLMTKNQANGDYVNVTKTADNQLNMVAGTDVPTTLMKVVGVPKMRIDVSCRGEKYFVNTDIMFVLDTTGSMNCAIGAADSCSAADEAGNSKMSNMRTAIKKLYTDLLPVQTALKNKQLRMRIGFVQYSQNTNVGKLLYAKDKTWIRNPYPYYNSSGTLKSPLNHTDTWFTTKWNGCIEERKTSSAITSTTTVIPNDAYDLDVATMPTNDDTRWAPADPDRSATKSSDRGEESYDTGSTTAAACTLPARPLQEWADQDTFDAHVNTIKKGAGRTHHDTGIIWGTRMIADVGVFGADNPNTFNNVKVSKTIVFMTDGLMDISPDYYTAYGVPSSAGRTAAKGASESTLEGVHKRRFTLMCNRAKELGVDIWVIGILTTSSLSSEMVGCATNSTQAIKVSNSTDLTAAFRRISDKVGNLRLGE